MKLLRPWLLLLGVVVVALAALLFASTGNHAVSVAAPRVGGLAPVGAGVSAPAAGVVDAPAQQGPVVVEAVKHDVSPPLASITPFVLKQGTADADLNELLPLPGRGTGSGPARPDAPFTDPVLQEGPVDLNIPSPIANFEGVNNVNGVLPPDTNGDVGPNHYMQWVNLSFAVYNRSGTLLYGPAAGNTLWSGFGGVCSTRNDGDPIALYDQLADRWMVSQFALPGGSQGYHQCIAVSQTGDPTGAWYRYDFLISSNKMNDYPHFGVWPDAYYMSVNQFTNGISWGGQGVVAFERDKMLLGQTARMVYFDLYAQDPNLGGMLPSDLDGAAPAAGTPNYFIEVDDNAWGYSPDQLQVWEFRVNWTTPSSSTFTRATTLGTAAFDSDMCGGSRSCIPQQGTTARLDAIADRIMYRLQYRNFGAYQTLVTNHTVDVNGADRAGVRWYELRNTGSGWSIYQQGTFSPDATHRWMGSIAMDSAGNIALGYSASSSTMYPAVRYTGRLASDALGTLPQGEGTIINGTGAQTHSAARWGDYSMMGVDPTDDCTFWYTNEYLQTTGSAPWRTRVGSFKFPNCGGAPTTGTLQGTVTDASTSNPISGALVDAGGGYSDLTDASGFYQIANLPAGSYNVTASATGYTPSTVNGVSITAGNTTTQNFALTPNPVSNTGFRSPTANAAASGGDGNGFQTNPTNAYANDGLFAVDTNSGNGSNTSCTSARKDKHLFYNYSFTLPSGASIQGIEVRLDGRADSTAGAPKFCVQLSWNGGASWTAAKSTPTLTTSEATYMLGSATDTWGRAWSDTNFSNTNLRVRIISVASASQRDFSLDWIAVQVTYQ